MPKSVIIPAGSSAPLAPFVPGTLADGVVYVSGTLAFDQHNNVLFADDPKAQTRHVLETIRKVIETAGGTMADVTFGNDSNLLIVFYVQIMPDDFVMQLHRF